MLDLYNSGFAFDNDTNYIMLDSDNPNIDIISINKIDTPGLDIYLDKTNLEHCIPEIPSTIKYLRLNCRAFHYTNLILPSTLEYLQLIVSLSDILDYNILDFITLPTSIKSLSISIILDSDNIENQNDNLINDAVEKLLNNINFKIPKNIEYLKINFHLPNIEEYTNLKVLVLDSFQNTKFNYQLDNLPATLEWLEIHSLQFNQPVNNLPSGLKVLIFGQNRIWNYHDGYQHSLDGLPSGLEVLHFPECCSLEGIKYLATFENLPPTLKILLIPRIMLSDMKYDCLPDSIEILKWAEFRKCYKNVSRFPANLKKIKCHIDSNSDDEKNKILKYFENMPFIIEDYLNDF